MQPLTTESKSATVGPETDWCTAINAAKPGDEIVLEGSEYKSPCWVTSHGEANAPVTVPAERQEKTYRPGFMYPGSRSNIFELRDAEHLVLRGLAFVSGPVTPSSESHLPSIGRRLMSAQSSPG